MKATHRKKSQSRVSRKKPVGRRADMWFWFVHSSHWLAAFVFIFLTLLTIYVFFAGDSAFASTLFPPRY